jgi:tetratricopeptide (TPR) repeat protein
MTAWTLMEEEMGNWDDARILFDRALKQFTTGTSEKNLLWTSYERMEKRAGNTAGALEVYQRFVRESFDQADVIKQDIPVPESPSLAADKQKAEEISSVDKKEYEVVRWDPGTTMQAEVWMNNGSIEGKVPKAVMGKKRSQKKDIPPV